MSQPQRIVAITGVSRGLGRELARGFAQRGDRVLGCARDASALSSLRAELGDAHAFIELDITDSDAVVDWAQSAPGPDLLINNAAVMNRRARAWELDAAEFDELLRINVSGTMNTIRAFLPGMLQRRSGLVVNFSSGWGRGASAEVAPYCASKYAIEGLTAALAQELPRGLGVIAVNPGIIDTAMLRTCWAESAGAYPTPDAWAVRAVPFLAGLTAAQNGQSLDM